jgi:hypothetical protein
MTVSINLPGGGIEKVSGDDLLWFRTAFPNEWKGAVMVRLAGEITYSIESISDLAAKFASDKAKLAQFTPPDRNLVMVANAANIRQIDAADPGIYHENANAILVFTGRTALAVRETPNEAQALVDQAMSGKSAPVIS